MGLPAAKLVQIALPQQLAAEFQELARAPGSTTYRKASRSIRMAKPARIKR